MREYNGLVVVTNPYGSRIIEFTEGDYSVAKNLTFHEKWILFMTSYGERLIYVTQLGDEGDLSLLRIVDLTISEVSDFA